MAAAYVFPPGVSKTASVNLNLAVPAGLALDAEVFVGPDQNTKKATTGVFAFTAAGAAQTVIKALVMPTVGGVLKTFVVISYQGTPLLVFVDDQDLIIISGTADVTYN